MRAGVELTNVRGIFYVLISGCILACVALAVELAFSRLHSLKNLRTQKKHARKKRKNSFYKKIWIQAIISKTCEQKLGPRPESRSNTIARVRWRNQNFAVRPKCYLSRRSRLELRWSRHSPRKSQIKLIVLKQR